MIESNPAVLAVAEALWPHIRDGLPPLRGVPWGLVTRGSLAHEAACNAARAAIQAMDAALIRALHAA